MDFPLFHLDFFGNRMLIAVIATMHVFINHALAVGALPLVALMEWWGYRKGSPQWDRLAYRVLAVSFVVTTSAGALSGVGIWLSASLVNPAAIGSLIRVFFLAWFIEWTVFCAEVLFIMVYFLTWKRMHENRKAAHIGVGVGLAAFSWLTMAIIVAILGFMMDPGNWTSQGTFLSGVLNPIYLPQLAFRTPAAMLAAGLFALFLNFFFTRRGEPIRDDATRFLSAWTLLWLPVAVAGALWYRAVIPGFMMDNVPVALLTQALSGWYETALWVLAAMVMAVLATSLVGIGRPRWLPGPVLLVPFLLALGLLGYFERTREFIRKPYVIGDYMYANGIRAEDYPLFREEGVLRHATYASTREVTAENRLQAGRDVFSVACTRCHTTSGVNSVVGKLRRLYGVGDWDRNTIKAYIRTMHNVRPYMPPFPGTDEEAGALADYLLVLKRYPESLPGAQSAGVPLPWTDPGRADSESTAVSQAR